MAVERLSAAWQTGQTVAVEIVRLADDFRLDWFDGVFKAAGWTTRQQAMVEDAITVGWYSLSVDAATWAAGEYLFALTDASIATQPIGLRKVSVVGGAVVGTAAVIAVSPVVASVTLTLVRGDDYLDADGRALDFVEGAGASWPDLTTATIQFGAAARVGEAQLMTAIGSVVVPSGAGKRVRVELPNTTTKTLRTGNPAYDFDVQATIATKRITLLRGTIFVVADYAA